MNPLASPSFIPPFIDGPIDSWELETLQVHSGPQAQAALLLHGPHIQPIPGFIIYRMHSWLFNDVQDKVGFRVGAFRTRTVPSCSCVKSLLFLSSDRSRAQNELGGACQPCMAECLQTERRRLFLQLLPRIALKQDGGEGISLDLCHSFADGA